MYQYLEITDVFGREILDSRGNPTVEVDVVLESGHIGRASVPSGASTGKFEAVELRDQTKRYMGLGVQKAVKHVNTKIAQVLIGENALEQTRLDYLLKEADGTDNKSNFGANAMLGASMAIARASALALEIPLYQYLGGTLTTLMPCPMMNILNGGVHADNTIDFQEFMIMPVGACCFTEALRICSEIYHHLKRLLIDKGYSTGVGDEGGFAPDVENTKEVLQLLVEAIELSGYKPGTEVSIAMDAAASELYDEKTGTYCFPGESKMTGHKVSRSSEELVAYYKELIQAFPIVSIEDGLHEEDWEGWIYMTEQLGDKIQLVGDDLFVTNTRRLACGIQKHAGNAILIKVNQIGTLTEAFEAVELAKNHGFHAVISHRSGETEDSMIADIAVALNAGQIKTGAPCRSDRVAKYNQLLRIEEMLNGVAAYHNPFAYKAY